MHPSKELPQYKAKVCAREVDIVWKAPQHSQVDRLKLTYFIQILQTQPQSLNCTLMCSSIRVDDSCSHALLERRYSEPKKLVVMVLVQPGYGLQCSYASTSVPCFISSTQSSGEETKLSCSTDSGHVVGFSTRHAGHGICKRVCPQSMPASCMCSRDRSFCWV